MRALPRQLLVLAGLAAAACTTPDAATDAEYDIAPGARPPLDSDEAGLWMQMDRVEGKLRTAGNRVNDPALNAYLRQIVCRLAQAYCADLKIYILEVPYLNASMAPNGVMQVWTGLLLRAQNEAQLAYVLGHELGHYLERHSIERWRDVRSKTDAAAVFNILTAGVGLGPLGALGRIAALGSVAAYSRDQERQADEIGLRLMASAGYDPREAPMIWQALREERTATDEDDAFIFLATHPAIEERSGTLSKQAEELAAGSATLLVGTETYRAAVAPEQATWLRDDLRLREFDRTQVLLDQLRRGGQASGTIEFFQGELYRLRGQSRDDAAAVQAYHRAIAAGAAPPEVFRSLAQVYLHLGQKPSAKVAYRRYLEEKPDAPDRALIESQMTSIE